MNSSRESWRPLVSWLILAGLAVLFSLPFLWMISTSLKQSKDVFTFPPSFLPNSFEWRNYIAGWTVLPFSTFLRNSLIVTCANVVGNLISCSLVAFGFARLRARGRDLLFLLYIPKPQGAVQGGCGQEPPVVRNRPKTN